MLSVFTRVSLLITFLLSGVICLHAQIVREERTAENYIMVVTQQSKVGVMDEDGRLIIDTVYEAITEYVPAVDGFWVKKKVDIWEETEGIAEIADISRDWGIVNVNNEVILAAEYEYPVRFDKGYAIVSLNEGKSGVVNSGGQEIIPFIYDEIYQLENNIFMVILQYKSGLADEHGKTFIEPLWEHISFLEGGYFLVYNENGQHGIVDLQGEFIALPGEEIITEIELRKYLNKPSEDEMYEDDDLEFLNRLDSLKNLQVRKLIENLLITTLFESDQYGISNNFGYFTTDMNIYYDEEAKGQISHIGEGGGGDLRVTISLDQLNSRYFSYRALYENCSFSVVGGGGAHCTSVVYFYNYAIKGDTILLITLADLFMEDSRFEEVLYAQIDSMAGTEAGKEVLLENFEITPAGLVFYQTDNYSFYMDSIKEIPVPYSAIKNIIKKDGFPGVFAQ